MEKAEEKRVGYVNLIVLVLSVYVLMALAVDLVFRLDPEVSRLLNLIDSLICVFFLAEFTVRFYRADSKLAFMKWGWIDLLSSIPTLEYLRPGRLIRVLRLLRILRAFRSGKHLTEFFLRNRIRGAFTSAALLAVLMVVFSSIAILQVEDTPDSNIKTAEDALWWAYTTLATVGYGDKYPVTTEGRIIGAALMTVGIGLFGIFTGFVASWFVEERIEGHERHELEECKNQPEE